MMAKLVSARKTTCPKPKSAMRARVLNESFGKTPSRKNYKEEISTINKKPRQFHMIKINKEVPLKTLETHFLYRKPQKLKIAKIVFRKLFS